MIVETTEEELELADVEVFHQSVPVGIYLLTVALFVKDVTQNNAVPGDTVGLVLDGEPVIEIEVPKNASFSDAAGSYQQTLTVAAFSKPLDVKISLLVDGVGAPYADPVGYTVGCTFSLEKIA